MKLLFLLFLGMVCGSAAFAQTCASIPVGFSLAANGGRLNGFVPFPSSAYWHRPITSAAADPNSLAYLANITQGANRSWLGLYPASQNGYGNTAPTIDGYPYHVVSGTQPRVNVIYDRAGAVPSQSDPGPMPIPPFPREQFSIVNGNPFPDYAYASTTDGHVIVIDKDNCVLYELYNVLVDGQGTIHANTGAVFDLLAGDNQRPLNWTSASVSGLPLFPGLLRDEELSGAVPINHPITVTFDNYSSGNFFPHHSWISPAEHSQYGGGTFNNYWWQPTEVPFGALLRLKANYASSSCTSPQANLLLNAMKTYGAILVDGGNTLDAYAASGWNWDAATTACLYTAFFVDANGDNFDVITSGNPATCDPEFANGNTPAGPHSPVCPNSASNVTGAVPVISGLTCASGCTTDSGAFHAAAGSTIQLTWSMTGSTLSFVTPNVGPVRYNSVPTVIQQTTTYTVAARNMYGTAAPGTITVTVGAGNLSWGALTSLEWSALTSRQWSAMTPVKKERTLYEDHI